ncbi:MAG: hypothetical protein COV91_01450 [Candidatus Taylorbacteria bacterium CG11_big_fil_rev_8_21_14_0_20_46_11]|uniref:Uncharacterized protein n=1 Tax=Candidatus Taylorbacteria bacterium CG11_big_fil_rev_8_21_14_0_20_46_11 TaxID=1975025 RepID=A0A2H0KCD6_9BACT|nr:MAG: hypothetical protein COV91_01450 [Candidatus Taylorbacteria bacterium CG11_big_fil_rev_8_21_14_0_20_46_11]
MNNELVLKICIGVVATATLGVGGYYLMKADGVRTLTQAFESSLEAGDYLAALGAAGNLRTEGKITPELEEQIAETARLLVAEDAYKKAKSALDEGRYADASALLRGSPAISNIAFKYFDEATRVYEEAEALVAGEVHKTNVTISNLENKAKSEVAKNVTLQKKSTVLEGTVKTQQQAIAAQDALVTATQKKLEQSQKDSDARQAALVIEQARAKDLMEAVAKESKQKFFTELRTYRDMAEKGRQQLVSALTEINAKRDVTALVYVNQSKDFFEDVKIKASDLRSSRTPDSYTGHVDDLLRSTEQFLEASKQFRNAVFSLEDTGSSLFTTAISNGTSALNSAVSYLSNVSNLIVSNPL